MSSTPNITPSLNELSAECIEAAEVVVSVIQDAQRVAATVQNTALRSPGNLPHGWGELSKHSLTLAAEAVHNISELKKQYWGELEAAFPGIRLESLSFFWSAQAVGINEYEEPTEAFFIHEIVRDWRNYRQGHRLSLEARDRLNELGRGVGVGNLKSFTAADLDFLASFAK